MQLRERLVLRQIPAVTSMLVLLNVLIFFWDRQGQIGASNIVFADLVMRAKPVVSALSGSPDKFPLVTMFTSMFLHGNLAHLVGNMIFLLVFGPKIEETIGAWRFALYYFGWGIVAAIAQIYVDPSLNVPILGASGAIGGVLGVYFLIFPTSIIELLFFPGLIPPVPVTAWKLLSLWFLFQIFFPQEGVANWAHVGGFLAGMLTVLAMGGSEGVLSRNETDT
jgi:membrane associated rhomboid family serine protease